MRGRLALPLTAGSLVAGSSDGRTLRVVLEFDILAHLQLPQPGGGGGVTGGRRDALPRAFAGALQGVDWEDKGGATARVVVGPWP